MTIIEKIKNIVSKNKGYIRVNDDGTIGTLDRRLTLSNEREIKCQETIETRQIKEICVIQRNYY